MQFKTLTGKTQEQIKDILNQDLPESAYRRVPGGANLTSIDPTYRNEKLTECFGVCGFGWGLNIPEKPDIMEYERRTSQGGREYSIWCIGYLYAEFWYKAYIDDKLERLEIPTNGYNENEDLGWALSGAKTSMISEATKPLLWQMRVYKGEYKVKPQSQKIPNEITLSFGKYNGETLEQVWEKDSGYIRWLAKEAQQDWLKKAASKLAQEKEKLPVQAEKESAKMKYEKEKNPATNQQRQMVRELFATCAGLDIKAADFLDTINTRLAGKGNRKLHEMGPVEAKSVIDALLKYKKALDKKEEDVENE